jgi:hypothetical protein
MDEPPYSEAQEAEIDRRLASLSPDARTEAERMRLSGASEDEVIAYLDRNAEESVAPDDASPGHEPI